MKSFNKYWFSVFIAFIFFTSQLNAVMMQEFQTPQVKDVHTPAFQRSVLRKKTELSAGRVQNTGYAESNSQPSAEPCMLI